MNDYDLIIIGGGLNGAALAADAAGRNLRVLLSEARDLPSPTTDIASGLLLGGLRHLQRLDLELAIRSIREQKTLLKRAPHLLQVRPVVIPEHPDTAAQGRPNALMNFLSWLAGRRLGRSEKLQLRGHPYGTPLHPEIGKARLYRDCSGDAARLVMANARLASSLGADIRPYTRVVRVQRNNECWEVELENCASFQRQTISARALINTSGRFTNELLRQHLGHDCRARSRMIKVTNLICEPLYEGDQVYMLTTPGGHRICINPLPNGLHLVGSAQQEYAGDTESVKPDEQAVEWLLEGVNQYLSRPLQHTAIRDVRCGLMPVADEPGKPILRCARNFVLDLDCPECRTPLLLAYGGRLVIARRMAEAAMELLKPWLPNAGQRWTTDSLLPGAAIPDGGTAELCQQLQSACEQLAPAEIKRMVSSYGSEAWRVLANGGRRPDPGALIGGHFRESELRYLQGHEWLQNADDLIWRRSNLGSRVSEAERRELEQWFASNPQALTTE